MRVLQDDISLFGFLNYEELAMFELLIGVSGIGAKSAINILSKIEPSKFALAVITNDVNTLKELPGIGPKSAQRIILELKDKIKEEQIEFESKEISSKINNIEKAQDAIDALQVLGYNRKDIEKVISKIENLDELSTEEIIKKGLKLL
jgi:Holliday junction DNA helicase RuvA